ncbi:MAG: hypothetical protein Q8O67_24110 [Deltaproteobacteria bacterium]|nr:hypothetical protein [Deltaproteobacteria bacterium]
MRALQITLFALAAVAAHAEEASPPPPPPLEEAPPPAPEPPPPVEVPAPDPVEDKATPAPAPALPPAEPPPAEGKPAAEPIATGFGGSVCRESALGCGLAGCLPAGGTALGGLILLTSISAGLAEGGCGGIVLILVGAVYGVVIGVPSAILFGPCATCGAVSGGVIGAMTSDREVTPVLLGSIPGIAAALIGTGLIAAGLATFSDGQTDQTLPIGLLIAGTAVSALSGPATIAGIAVADGMEQEKKPPLPPAPAPKSPAPSSGPQVAMAW